MPWFILSMNMMPGSPFFHALFTIRLKTSLAFSLRVDFPECGFIKSYSSSFSNAFINTSVIATDRLKLFNWALLSFAWIKSRISGWSTLSIPIFAPLLVPPCFIASVAESKTVINEMGPDEIPFVEPTISPFGLRFENEKPVPPPDLCIIAAFFTASKIDSIESSTGRTKQADSCPSLLPAFIRVGLLGRNFNEVINS